jgi:hypothetical protein
VILEIEVTESGFVRSQHGYNDGYERKYHDTIDDLLWRIRVDVENALAEIAATHAEATGRARRAAGLPA